MCCVVRFGPNILSVNSARNLVLGILIPAATEPLAVECLRISTRGLSTHTAATCGVSIWSGRRVSNPVGPVADLAFYSLSSAATRQF